MPREMKPSREEVKAVKTARCQGEETIQGRSTYKQKIQSESRRGNHPRKEYK
jgi:hypothetical protein